MKKNKPHGAGHSVRKFLLVLEVFFISVFLLGGSSFSSSFSIPFSENSPDVSIKSNTQEEEIKKDADTEDTENIEIKDAKAEDTGTEKINTEDTKVNNTGTEKIDTEDTKTENTGIEKTQPNESHNTPEFAWENYRTIAHALGGLDGETYLNSKESFIESYEKGCRLFEVDLVRTSDQVWVCRHSWNQSLGQWEEEGKKILTAQEFLSTPVYGKYTPMSFRDLLILLKDYPDAFVLLDSKQYSIRNYRKTIEDYAEYLEIAAEADAKESLDQIIPEIYNEAMFPGTALAYRFPSYIYSLWQEYTIEEITEIGDYCREKGIPAVTVYEEYWTEEIQEIFDSREILVYVYTVNDSEKAAHYMEKGAAGICTDTLLVY